LYKNLVLSTVIVFLFSIIASAQPVTKVIVFDTLRSEVKDPPNDSLYIEKGKLYLFRIAGTNNAYYETQFSVQQLSKTISIPASLQGIVPDGSAGLLPLAFFPSIGSAPTNMDSVFFSRLVVDFTILHDFFVSSQNLLNNLNKKPNNIADYHLGGDSLLRTLAHSMGISIPLDSFSVKMLDKSLDSVVSDFLSRVALLKEHSLLHMDSIGLRVYKAYDFIEKNQKTIRAFPDILYACKRSNLFIDSKPYKMGRADYLKVSFTLYAGKYSSAEDSLLTKQIVYYASRYWRFDVTSGFFYSNLTSQYYYFTDSMAHYQKESKSSFDLSVGALVHFNRVFTPDVKAGLCVGGGLSLLDAKTKALAGISLIIGRKYEFAFSGGASFSSIPVPSHTLNNTTIPYISSPEATVPTYNKIATGVFFGVSYSLVNF
jgi:hypothetical protein